MYVYRVGSSVLLAGRYFPDTGQTRQGKALNALKSGSSQWKAWSSKLVTASQEVPANKSMNSKRCRACLLIKAFRLLRFLLHSSHLIASHLSATRIALTINTSSNLSLTSYNHGTTVYLAILGTYAHAQATQIYNSTTLISPLCLLLHTESPSHFSPPCLLSHSKCRAP